jgi:hypothetical protein
MTDPPGSPPPTWALVVESGAPPAAGLALLALLGVVARSTELHVPWFGLPALAIWAPITAVCLLVALFALAATIRTARPVRGALALLLVGPVFGYAANVSSVEELGALALLLLEGWAIRRLLQRAKR